MRSLGGQASWAKMTSLGGKLTALAGHQTKFVKKSWVTNLSLYKHCLLANIKLGWKLLAATKPLAYNTVVKSFIVQASHLVVQNIKLQPQQLIYDCKLRA